MHFNKDSVFFDLLKCSVIVAVFSYAVLTIVAWGFRHDWGYRDASLVGVLVDQWEYVSTLRVFPGGNDPQKIVLNEQSWICTDTATFNYPSSAGTLTRFGRVGAHSAYQTTECIQWSRR